MYWTYLVKFEEGITNKNINKKLTFEKNYDFDRLKLGYCELILDNYFQSFETDFNHIIISEYGPLEDPINNENKFIIKFDDIEKAKYLLHNSSFIMNN